MTISNLPTLRINNGSIMLFKCKYVGKYLNPIEASLHSLFSWNDIY